MLASYARHRLDAHDALDHPAIIDCETTIMHIAQTFHRHDGALCATKTLRQREHAHDRGGEDDDAHHVGARGGRGRRRVLLWPHVARRLVVRGEERKGTRSARSRVSVCLIVGHIVRKKGEREKKREKGGERRE